MKNFFAALPIIASLASAGPVSLGQKDSDLVNFQLLERDGNTGIKATFTNAASYDLKFFVPGTVLDDSPVEKVTVTSADTRVPFDGVRLRMAPEYLVEEDSFRAVKAGETIDLHFDFGLMHDVTNGGDFNVTASGDIPYATNGTDITGYIHYKSNTLTINSVNGTQVAIARRDFHDLAKRTNVENDCKGSQNNAVTTALNNCKILAVAAARAALSNDTKMDEYFKIKQYSKADQMTVKRNVSVTFSKVATECGSRNSGVAKLYCSDVYNMCKPGVLAYTVPALTYMVYCPLYFSALPALTTGCHNQDQASTTLHEMTHLLQLKGTLDYGVYGYSAVRSLTKAQNINHADTYCLFANSVNLPAIC